MASTVLGTARWLAPCSLLTLAGLAAARPREFVSDPPAPRHRARYAPSWGSTDGPGAVRQVNFGPGGQNILGDAGNEPSLAVDPTAPNRIAIGWRQFDSVASNFRQAGRAYSKDGGRTWTFPGVVDPGVFRSDPVLRADLTRRIFYYSLTNGMGNNTCQVFRSTDGGQTFGPLVPPARPC